MSNACKWCGAPVNGNGSFCSKKCQHEYKATGAQESDINSMANKAKGCLIVGVILLGIIVGLMESCSSALDK